MKEHRITTIRFDGHLKEREIPSFRGAVIALSGNDPLYHNHKEDDGFQFRYPRIQYKVLDGDPALVGIDDGAVSLESLFPLGEMFKFQVGRELRKYTVKQKDPGYFLAVEEFTGVFQFSITNWIPFNRVNYYSWHQLRGLAQKVSFLDDILVGNILSFYKDLGVFFARGIHAQILDMVQRNATYKGINMVTFNLKIETDVALPAHFGIGKGVSHGFGVVEDL